MLSESAELVNWDDPTPKFLADLGHTFLYVKNGETVADIACGTGEFLKYVASNEKDVSLYGCEIYSDIYEECVGRKELSFERVKLENRNAFTLVGEKQFDKVFVHPPFGQRIPIEGEVKDSMNQAFQSEFFERDTTCSDLLFAILATQVVKDNGYAIAILSASSCSNVKGRPFRRCIAESGYLNMVISLPSMMLENTSVPIVAIGLCKDSTNVRMVDATGFGTKEGRRELRSGTGVRDILLAYEVGSEDVFDVPAERIVQEDYDFLPEKFMKPSFRSNNAIELQEVLKLGRRGVINGCKSKTRPERREAHKGTLPFVRAHNIEDGVFHGTLDRIGEEFVPEKATPLQEGDILISKTGRPFKCAVVDHLPAECTYFQENLYLLRVDERKVDPYYLCAFFNSDSGQASLCSAMVNGGTLSLPIQKLKHARIFLPQMEKQQDIGIQFQHACEDIKDAKCRFKEAIHARNVNLREIF